MSVAEGDEQAFITALDQARKFVEASPGCLGLTYHQGVERPQTFLLVIRWETLADHVEGFRNSTAFADWRAVLGPLFTEPPVVEHWQG